MNTVEAAKLLTIVSGIDRRVVDELTARAWASLLVSVSFEDAQAAVLAHYADPVTRHDYLTVGHVLDRVEAAQRLSRSAVEADVRSAKARGLIDSSWPVREPLPGSVVEQLAAARQADKADMLELSDG